MNLRILISRAISFLVLAFLLTAEPALSCPKCFATTGKSVLQAYYVSIGFMILIPLGIVVAVSVWLHNRHKRWKESGFANEPHPRSY